MNEDHLDQALSELLMSKKLDQTIAGVLRRFLKTPAPFSERQVREAVMAARPECGEEEIRRRVADRLKRRVR